MFKLKTILFTSIIFWVISSSFSIDDMSELPTRKISKSIEKIWKTDNFRFKEMDLKNEYPCITYGLFLKVVSQNELLGYLYSGRVNSCNAGGCSVEANTTELTFEYFDYYVLMDSNKQVIWVKIYNYQATHGHEVMSRGWLNQFRGIEPGESLQFGKDIEAISGATVSATAITEDIQQVLKCL